MKKKLIILSDLWGAENPEWLGHYVLLLEKDYNIKYYDCCELGGVNKLDHTKESLHKQFIQSGIDRAVQHLVQLEKEMVSILAFSIGGTIAWKFGLKGGNIESLVCISSTRLRLEVVQPKGIITLFYGSSDLFKPSTVWLQSMKVNYVLLEGKGHQVYSSSAKKLSASVFRVLKKNQATK